jgi:hypothetical protein
MCRVDGLWTCRQTQESSWTCIGDYYQMNGCTLSIFIWQQTKLNVNRWAPTKDRSLARWPWWQTHDWLIDWTDRQSFSTYTRCVIGLVGRSPELIWYTGLNVGRSSNRSVVSSSNYLLAQLKTNNWTNLTSIDFMHYKDPIYSYLLRCEMTGVGS